MSSETIEGSLASVSPLLTLRAFLVGPPATPRVGPLDLTVEDGETIAVLGASGSGKSQLLRGLAVLEPANYAQARIRETDFGDLETPERRRRLLYVHQEPVRFDGDVRANLERMTGGEKLDAALEHMAALGLALEVAEQSMATLSGGQAVRVVLARALAVAQQVLLLDEPTAMLDDAAIARVIERLDDWKRAGEHRAILWAQHPSAATLAAADRFLLVDGGRHRWVSTPEEALEALRATCGGRS